MPEANTTRRPVRPAGFTTARWMPDPTRPVRLFLPDDYQPKYAYPLIVILHASGSDEDSAARLAPQLSRRNYIAACPRGPVNLGADATGRPAYSWEANSGRLTRTLLSVLKHTEREYHVHNDRVYLLGVGEGAAVAYRLGLALRDRIAGDVALNGAPATGRSRDASGLRVFVGHGSRNPVVPLTAARKTARTLSAAGAEVRFQPYATTHRIGEDMLRDVNRWIMQDVNPDLDQLPDENF